MKKQIIIGMIALISPTFLMAQKINYPTPPSDKTMDKYFGIEVLDPYRPLENDTAKATINWVKAENSITSRYLSKIPFRGKILKRMKELANYEKHSFPWYNKHTKKWYFYLNNGLQNQSVLYVMDKLGDEKKAQVFIDPNKFSTDGTVALKSVNFSNNGKYVAYAISRNGSDWQEFYVIDANTGKLLKDHIKWSKFSNASWLGDGFYYSAYDSPKQGNGLSNINSVQKIFYHKIGTPQSDDVLFYQNPEHPMRFYTVSINEDETMMFLTESGAGQGNGLYVRNLKQKDSQFIQINANLDVQCNPIKTIGDNIYILTDEKAPTNKLVVTDIHHLSKTEWKTIIPASKNVLEDVTFADKQLIITYIQDACSHSYLYSIDGKLLREIKFPSLGSVSFSGDFYRPEIFYSFTSFTEPTSIYKYDINKNTSKIYTAPNIKFNKTKFITEQIYITSKDGTKVPVFLTYKKGLKRNAKNPLLLYAYGGFGISLTPSFSFVRLPFIENGGIYAMACLRGGNEFGEAWHLAGTKINKQNVFNDFISAAEYLIKAKYTNKDLLAIQGGSNGGLLIGACMTQRPELYKVCIPQVGVMDMLRYHKFTIGWNWASDYGTSADSKEMFLYLKSYSPLHNIKKGTSYPATLITTADHDDRVVPAHSFKFAAALQAANAGRTPTLIRIDTNAGHGGGKPLSKQLEEQADIYSFILYNMGLKY